MSPFPLVSACTAIAVDVVVHVVAATEDWRAHLPALSEEEQGRADGFRLTEDRVRFVCGRAALRRLLGERLGTAPDRVVITIGPNGRPSVVHPAALTLDFNLSHSGTRIAIGFAVGGRIGVDIERHRGDRDLRAFADGVTGPRERRRLSGLDDGAFADEFYACWTRKEALVKALGLGLSYPPSAIDIPALPPDGVVALQDPALAPADRVWTVRTQQVDRTYTLSIAVEGTAGTITVLEQDVSR